MSVASSAAAELLYVAWRGRCETRGSSVTVVARNKSTIYVTTLEVNVVYLPNFCIMSLLYPSDKKNHPYMPVDGSSETVTPENLYSDPHPAGGVRLVSDLGIFTLELPFNHLSL